jgi:hypothetical protein
MPGHAHCFFCGWPIDKHIPHDIRQRVGDLLGGRPLDQLLDEMKKERHATISFTYRELRALAHALRNSTDHDDAMDSLFPDEEDRLFCRLGERKIRLAASHLESRGAN